MLQQAISKRWYNKPFPSGDTPTRPTNMLQVSSYFNGWVKAAVLTNFMYKISF